MKTRSRLNDVANLTGFQRKRRVFKLFLHVSFAEEASVVYVSSRAIMDLDMGRAYKSPLFLELLQSLSVVARSPKLVAPLLILASCANMILIASSFDRVICDSRQLEGLRESLCFTRRCDALILPSCCPAPSGLRFAELWYVPM